MVVMDAVKATERGNVVLTNTCATTQVGEPSEKNELILLSSQAEFRSGFRLSSKAKTRKANGTT